MVSRNNHYLSQMYLRNWTRDRKVYVYNLLVPDERIPLWIKRGTASIGSYDSMFVRLSNGEEVDDIEKDFAKNYEDPAKDALDKAINGRQMTEDDWYSLIEFVACHIVRSPMFINEVLRIQKEALPNALEDLKETLPHITKEEALQFSKTYEDNTMFPLHISEAEKVDSEHTMIKIETVIGKQSYLWAMEYLLKKTTYILHQHKWSIATVDDSVSLPTTDNPVVFLNYNNMDNYSLDGAWNSSNTNIIFPISPKKMLICQVGVKCNPRITFNKEMSEFFKKVIVENAYKTVISQDVDNSIPLIRARVVDNKEYQSEKNMWSDFQKSYLEKEAPFIRS
ncbi:MAG: hypothetical protein F083_2390 [bacterium F083]|nr:MAG: hypothetical protein F083_2390 [bacterium F083]